MSVRSAIALAASLSLATLVTPGLAGAAKVSEKAQPVVVPDAAPSGAVTVIGEAVQTFKLKGSKVKGRQVLDVDLRLNLTSAPGTESGLDITFLLVGPRGDHTGLFSPAANLVDVELDDQADLFACNPANTLASNCNYIQGGVLTGRIHASLNPTFRGLNPKGTWRLLIEDSFNSGEPPTTVGVSTLQVKTGRKFAKD